MTFSIPAFSLVILIGPSGSGKTTFARKHFKSTEILTSDFCRALVSDDENNQNATKDAFEVLHFIAAKRLAAGRLTVIDATNVQPEARKPLVALAREYHALPVAFVFDLPEHVCVERNKARADRPFGRHVIATQRQQLRRGLRRLKSEGFRGVHILSSTVDVDETVIEREPLWCDLRSVRGPFDIIGDVHGCYDELAQLLSNMGYSVSGGEETPVAVPPPGRKAIFLGDLVDRGPKIVPVLRLAMRMVADGAALCVPGNHDMKLVRKLRGKDVKVAYGLAETLEQLSREPDEFRIQAADFLDDLVSHYVLDGGRLVVAHAGMKESMQGRGSGRVREFGLYGETTGETDEFGLPVRYNWAAEYRGKSTVVYGHTPVPAPRWLNRTINIDTGCVFGGALSALRYPEMALASVPAARVYCVPAKPFLPEGGDQSTDDASDDGDLRIEDVLGKRLIETRLMGNITIREENSTAALEVMSRFAIDPHWLIYLPPTMAPPESAKEPGRLEHPREAFAYYRDHGVSHVLCEEKHMGSRVVILLCRDESVAAERFGAVNPTLGACHTRTGRAFFGDAILERQVLERLHTAVTDAGLWDELRTSWMALDAELMPWSAKALELLKQQYAATGASSRAALRGVLSALSLAQSNPVEVAPLLERYGARQEACSLFTEAYRRYCWPAETVDDYRIAPFHLLASEDAVHVDTDHLWHMNMLERIAAQDKELIIRTAHRLVDLTDESSVCNGIRWWEDLTGNGGEGMVVKPLSFMVQDGRRLLQPAIKCRGAEYLRIIYGPEYNSPEHLDRLRVRSLGAKRSLALREFALGIESLERFVRREPLHRVHECVFGVLALESEPVDPRL